MFIKIGKQVLNMNSIVKIEHVDADNTDIGYMLGNNGLIKVFTFKSDGVPASIIRGWVEANLTPVTPKPLPAPVTPVTPVVS